MSAKIVLVHPKCENYIGTTNFSKLMQIRCQKDAGTRMHKCLIECIRSFFGDFNEQRNSIVLNAILCVQCTLYTLYSKKG